MRFLAGAVVLSGLLGQTTAIQLYKLATSSDSIPSCSLDCLETLVPEYCGSSTNTTCLCTDATLTAELGLCALAACNVTDTFKLEKYKADVCGVANDRTRLQEQLNCYYILPALATIFLVARLWTRATKETVGPDDWMMVAAWLFYMTDIGCGTGMMVNKFGLHTYQLTTKEMENNLMYFYICELWYIITITLTKLSLLLFFQRIFPQREFKRWTWIIFAYTSISNLAVLLGLTFQCVPFHGNWTNWEYKVPPVKCINSYTLVYFAASNSIFQDLAILALPIPTLLGLNLAWQKKGNLLVMFSVGAFVILCSVLRLPSLIKLKNSTDPSWDQAPIGLWTNLEQSVGIVCGCLPACRSLAGHLFPCLKMSFSKSSHATPPYYKNSRPTIGTGDRSFMELQDQSNNRKKYPSGLTTINDSDEYVPRTVNSNESKLPINGLVELGGVGGGGKYGGSVDIHAEPSEGKVKGKGITLTMEVDQSSERN